MYMRAITTGRQIFRYFQPNGKKQDKSHSSMELDLINQIRESAKELFPEVVQVRRELHQHPELSFTEINTSERIKNFLARHGIPFSDGWAGYGVVATIKGEQEGPVKMLRADIDALPIQEKTELPFQSACEGVMHACGHDIHTSALLGAAAILQKHRKNIAGEVQLIFQPGEEKLPGGASIMIKEGLLTKYNPQSI